MAYAYNCTKNTATGYSPYFLLFGREPRLPIDVYFGLQRDAQKIQASKSNFIEKLKRRLKYSHKMTKQVTYKQQERHKGLYDQRCRGVPKCLCPEFYIKSYY